MAFKCGCLQFATGLYLATEVAQSAVYLGYFNQCELQVPGWVRDASVSAEVSVPAQNF